MPLRFQNIRTRLTLWYTAILALLMILFALISLGGLYWRLTDEMDDALAEDYEIIERLIEVKPDGELRFPGPADPEFHDRWFEVWSENGQLVYQSRPIRHLTLGPPPSPATLDAPFSYTSRQLANGMRTRQFSGTMNLEGKRYFIRIARSEEEVWEEVRKVAGFMGFSFLIVLVLSLAGGHFLAGRMLRPIDRMTRKARQISAENLGERLPVVNPEDELGRLATVMNSMLERLQRAFEELRRFTADAAHELRTPLTAIRSVGEVGMQNHKSPEEYREIIGSMLEETDRLSRLVDNLLFLTRADASRITLNREEVRLLDEISRVAELLQPLAEEKDQRISVEGQKTVRVSVDRLVFREALINILDNAIKYSPRGGRISVRVSPGPKDGGVVEISDNGPGIPPEHRAKIFERFYRVDKGRSRAMGGTGLGLSIARWAVEVHGGHIELESQVGKGSTFRIVLPGLPGNSSGTQRNN